MLIAFFEVYFMYLTFYFGKLSWYTLFAMASGIEHKGLHEFNMRWRMPIAVLDRFPASRSAERIRRAIAHSIMPADILSPNSYLAIGQEALVLRETNLPGRVTKYLPTNPAVAPTRADFINHVLETTRNQPGMGERYTDEAQSVNLQKRGIEIAGSSHVVVQTQDYLEGNDIKDILTPVSGYSAQDHGVLAHNVRTLADLTQDGLDGHVEFVHDIQGRGTNVVIDDKGELKILDWSAFSTEKSTTPELHPLSERERRNTGRILAQLAAWLDT
jgi:hypothetical protein